jgi:hypothetical protein
MSQWTIKLSQLNLINYAPKLLAHVELSPLPVKEQETY